VGLRLHCRTHSCFRLQVLKVLKVPQVVQRKPLEISIYLRMLKKQLQATMICGLCSQVSFVETFLEARNFLIILE
jgi:hypothetical protein